MTDSNNATDKSGNMESSSAEGDVMPSDYLQEDANSEMTADSADQHQAARASSRGGAVAWIALILAALALLGFGYQWFISEDEGPADDQAAAEVSSLTNSLRATRDSLDTLEQSVSSLAALDGTRAAETATFQRELENRMRQMDTLPGRIGSIEGTIASLQGVSTGARNAWLLAEAEYYMQIANAQLQLAGNPHLATLALTLADERILQLADPGLVEVRRALSNELRALEVLEKPDIEGITLTLASLAGAVAELPLRQELQLEATGDTALDPQLTGVDRALASLKGAFGKVVSVRRTDEPLKPLISPQAQYFLRANLALQLQAARLAVLRNEEVVFGQSIDDAAAWLAEYYDTSSDAVQKAQQTLSEVRGSVFSIAVPDISESLRLLRQFVNFSSVAAGPRPADPEVTPENATIAEPEAESAIAPEPDANDEPEQ